MTKQSDELKQIIKTAKELDAATAARVLVVIADIIESVEDQILEFKQQARETNVIVQKAFLDTGGTIQTLRSELAEYRLERNASELEEKAKAYEIAKRRAASVLSTSEKIQVDAAVKTALGNDKIDIRGIKVSSKHFTYILIGVIVLLVLLIFMLPDVISQILLRLAGMIGGTP